MLYLEYLQNVRTFFTELLPEKKSGKFSIVVSRENESIFILYAKNKAILADIAYKFESDLLSAPTVYLNNDKLDNQKYLLFLTANDIDQACKKLKLNFKSHDIKKELKKINCIDATNGTEISIDYARKPVVIRKLNPTYTSQYRSDIFGDTSKKINKLEKNNIAAETGPRFKLG